MIKRLYIKDFRNIKELTIEPSEYVNLISGNNGEGKSSILYAIEYCLTDNLNEKISEYVRWGCDKFFLEMTFDHSGSEYIIKIEGDKTAKKELKVDGNTYKNSEATKKLAEIIDPNIIRYSSISEQGKTAQILFDTPANRLKKLKEILGIDKISELCLDLKEDIDKKQIEINFHDKEMKVLEDKTYNFMEVPVVGDIEPIKVLLDSLEKDKNIYELQNIQYASYLKDLKLYENAQMNILTHSLDIENSQKEIIVLEGSQKTFDHTETEEELREQFSKYEKEKIKLDYDISKSKEIKNDIEFCLSEIDINNKQLETLQLRRLGGCSVSKEDILEQEQLVLDLEIKQARYKEELKLAVEGKCPTCGKDYVVDIKKLQKESEDNSQAMLISGAQLTLIKRNLDDYNKDVNEQEKIKIKRQNIIDNSNILLKRLEVLKEELAKCSVLYDQPDYDSLLKDIKDKLKNRQEVVAFNVDISNKIRDLKNNILTGKKLQESYETTIKPDVIEKPIEFDYTKYEDCKKEINIHEQKVKQKESVELFNEQIEEEKKNDKLKIKSLISLIDSISYKVGILKESRQVLDKDFSAWLIDQGAEYLKEKMNQFFQLVSSKYIITFSQDKNSIDFFYGDEENVSPCSMASGMEKSILAISFRVALCSLNNLNLMILDEIDSEFSEENSLKLYETLLESMRDYQIFCITHVEDTKDYIIQQLCSKHFLIQNGGIL